jgi:predicted RNA-binding Zn-ribbon protein involved in translation (DUF1610 family)
MSAQLEVRKGIKVAADEVTNLDPQQIGVLLPANPPQTEVEGQSSCSWIQCPYCSATGRCTTDWVPGSYYRCKNCGSLFRT